MNAELRRLALQCGLESPRQARLALRFAHACVTRVAHLLEDEQAITGLQRFGVLLQDPSDDHDLAVLASEMAALANRHQGSRSLDGSQHAAVSATYALAQAVSGKAVAAAEYAAYSKVYAYGGYAVHDLESFSEEYAWQVECLQALLARAATPQSA
jgi:hypothetical protein